ncbi:MAG: DEAD/DEAH box helicase, partial [Patescibacteria group bacterium]
MLNLDTSIEKINKVGKVTAKKLNKLSIKKAQDLLEYYPFRYEDYSKTVKIADLQPGAKANVRGIVEIIQNRRTPRQRMMVTEAIIKDETEQLKVVWFNQPYIGRTLKEGDFVSLAGEIKADFAGVPMTSPQYEKIFNNQATHTAGLVPMYNLTAGLTNKQLRFLIKSIISLADKIDDILPNELQEKYKLINLQKAIYNIHFPKSPEILEQAKRRLKFDELFLVQLASQVLKSKVKGQKAEEIKFYEKETKKFVDNLPFKLTDAQKKASWEILQDIEKDRPMSRLLEGDVGSGKTVTVALAMLNVALNKKQSALLVPTEILASQHFETLCKFFKNSGIKVGLLTRSSRKINNSKLVSSSSKGGDETKKNFLKLIKDGKLDIIIGTHA